MQILFYFFMQTRWISEILQARKLVAVLPELFPDSVLPVLARINNAEKAEEMLAHDHHCFSQKSAGDKNGAAAVLNYAIKWWKTAMTEDEQLNVIMRAPHGGLAEAQVEGKTKDRSKKRRK
ncbi:hypothetical protein GOBAR_AA22995 [Gossypium barbadense]|uniref:Uncharacterized protein n=1 Tax=Gossypium barbadense TaxID=3634 RepID=A0A2P5X2X6_GOSBA|nr:hypothetical protein GOBAR_AA22995 [Gossypium barbadense]